MPRNKSVSKKRVNLKSSEMAAPSCITWKEVVIFLVVGYVLISIAQAVFCGTMSVGACSTGFWAIPVWLILGAVYYFTKHR